MYNINSVDLSRYDTVFCDSLQALKWSYSNGLSMSATIKSSAPAVLWSKNKNIHNIESRWSTDELEKFQNTIQQLTSDVFDAALNVVDIERELAVTISRSAYHFQKIIYKAACLEDSDFIEPRLFIHVDGNTGSVGNVMNSPWDQLLSHNLSFLSASYTLKNDKWRSSTDKGGGSYLQRFKVAGYETIIYRLAVKLMKIIPDRIFSKELFMPNENELNIEIASSLAMHGVKIIEVKSEFLPDIKDVSLGVNTDLLYKEILPIMRKRVKQWVAPSAVDVTMSLFKCHIEKQLNQFKTQVSKWEKLIIKSDTKKQYVLVNAPGNINGSALSYVCRKKGILLMSSQHGVTVEISKAHNTAQILFDNSACDIVFSYNPKIVEVEKSTYFDKSKHYSVGMPLRLIRMKHMRTIASKSATPIVYISTNLYYMGLSLSLKTDYDRAINEQKFVTEVLSKLPHKIRYKTYPEDNRWYADNDPVLTDVELANNIELFSSKIDMRYLISEHSIFITTCATSTLGWPVMSGKPVVFINQKENTPLTDEAYISLSNGLFVFNDDDNDFYKNIREFLSQSIEEIERLWENKQKYHKEMIREYFSEYESGAGLRATRIILKDFLD